MPQMNSPFSGMIGFGPDWPIKTEATFTSGDRNPRHPSCPVVCGLFASSGERDLPPRRLGVHHDEQAPDGNEGTGLAEALPGLAGFRILAWPRVPMSLG
jgi:hypothetical protein